LKHQQRIEQARTETPERRFVSGETVLFLGEERILDIVSKSSGRRTTVTLRDSLIRVSLRPGVNGSDRPAEVKAALECWFHDQAGQYIVERVAELARRYGFEYQKVTIRDQNTRWGSCSGKRNLNFNRRLIMAPLAAIDYVIVHELCHLRELNHSRQFWALVAQYCPEYARWRKWFKTNGHRLRL
jgi:predicted metal-dependent hydrolase